MSNKVVVFSTYYSKKIRDFFRTRLQDDQTYLGKLVTSLKNKNIIDINDKRLNDEQVKSLLEKYNIKPSKGDDSWVDKLCNKYVLDNELSNDDKNRINGIISNPQAKYYSISEVELETLLDNINKDNQQPFDIYNNEAIGNNEKKKKENWVWNRFSYYKLKQEEPSDIAVYAVWALKKIAQQEAWIEALTEQFHNLNNDAEDIFLIIHNKDIGNSPGCDISRHPYRQYSHDSAKTCEK